MLKKVDLKHLAWVVAILSSDVADKHEMLKQGDKFLSGDQNSVADRIKSLWSHWIGNLLYGDPENLAVVL